MSAVSEKGDDASTPFYIDGQVYLNRKPPSTFAGTISAFMYPDEFEPYNGVSNGLTGQIRRPFGFSYRSNREIHLVYNVLAEPSPNQYKTLSESVDMTIFSWNFSTLPVAIPAGRPSAHIVVNTDFAVPAAVAELEDLIYGDDENSAALPSPQVVYDIFDAHATLRIIDNGDGSWTATGPDDVITFPDADSFQISWPSAAFLDTNTYRIHSL